jgi:hypothetical protein
VLVGRLNVASPRRFAVAPLRLQLLELGLAAVALYLAIHLGATVSVALVVVAIVICGLALATDGPIGVVRRLSSLLNIVLLTFVAVGVALTPIAFRSERSTRALVVLEVGATLIGLTILGVVRGRGTVGPSAADRPIADSGGPSLSPSTRSLLRTAGRVARRARDVAARESPKAARRVGRSVGSRRRGSA